MDWYVLSIIAFFCYGIQAFLFKVSAEKKCNTAWTTFSFMLTVAILSSILFIIFKETISHLYLLLFLAFINATTFLTTTITRIEALKHLQASIAYPLVRLSTVIVVIFSIIYFKDALSIYQVLGIIFAVVALIVLTRNNQKTHPDKKVGLGIVLAIIAILSGAVTTIMVKFAAIMVNKFGFMAVAYIYNVFLSLGLIKRLQTKRENPKHKNAIIIGFFIGLFNFVGFYSILRAYAIGPLSLAASINSLAFVIAIFLSLLIYKEKITLKSGIGIALSIIAIVLLGV